MTLFTATATPRETSARIWDLFLVEGYCVIHRVALAVLYRSQTILLTMDFEGIIHHLKVAERDKGNGYLYHRHSPVNLPVVTCVSCVYVT
jgi:hypothetical protein